MNSTDAILVDKVLMMTHLDWQKRFPMYHVSHMLGSPSLRLGDTKEFLNIPSSIGWGGNDTGRLVTWEFPLRIDSASWKSLIHTIDFIPPFLYLVNKFMDRISIFDLSYPRNCVECWTLKSLPFFHLIETFLMNFTNIPIFSNICTWNCWSLRSFSSLARALYFFCHNRPGVRVFESLLDNQREFTLFVFPVKSQSVHIQNCVSESWALEIRETTVDQTTTLPDILLDNDKLVHNSYLLALGWTMVKRTPCRWWRHRTRNHSGFYSRPKIPGCMVEQPPWCGSRWTHMKMMCAKQTRNLSHVCTCELVRKYDVRDMVFTKSTHNFHSDLIATILRKCLLLLCALLFQQSHLFPICVVWTCNDSNKDLHKLCQIPRNCRCKWL